MSRLKVALFVMVGLALAAQAAVAQPGPVRLTVMNRVENHSSITDAEGNFGSETYNYLMISASRQLQNSVLGNIFYLNRYSFDDNKMITHIGGVNITKAFSRRAIFTLGSSHTSNPERGVIRVTPDSDRDRFSSSLIYNFNPKAGGPRYSSVTSFSTVTDLGEQQTMGEKLKVVFPIGDKWQGGLSYNYTYSLKESEQLTNQFQGNLTYAFNKRTKLVLGALFIDNVYEDSAGNSLDDNTVVRLSIYRSIKTR